MSATTTINLDALRESTGRDLDGPTLLRQIGRWNVAAISGGRWSMEGPSTLRLPVSNGFHVLVTLEADDTYTVRRIFARGGKVYDHGARHGVHCDEVGEAAYYASCFRSHAPGEWQAARG